MTWLQILPIIVLWTMVAIRLLGLCFGWRPGILPAVSLVALGATLNIDPVYLAVDQYLGGWNLLNLMVHLLMGLGMTELSRLLLRVTGRSHHVKVLISIGSVLAVAQIVLLLVSNTEGSAASFTDTFGDTPTVALYQASFFAWFGMITGYTGWETLRRNRRGESRPFRIGFDILCAGCMAGVLAAATKMIQIGLEIGGVNDRDNNALVTGYHVLLALMIVGFAVGFILPSYERIRQTFRARTECARDLAALRPVMGRLVQTPEGRRSMGAANIVLDARASKAQLYRWFIFIGDIRVLDPGLLSPQETRIIDEIGTRIEHNSSPAQRTAAPRG
ncbi:hypothetical protein MUG94_03395 [Arthrobacter gengyunqii]|uniref:Uncharacterized protein n=1 Tax=Arthrobacter gengyunqii TaxID=2886940 RepID=A0A9X1M3X7_9MICC|nr:hypothetical protein [Arthrobacter gengyunqii]MCC3270127.1 hypothetical protein [Arthrobacter gengyunqii]UOY96833.1 hypothetical protein MUG94_03395 [Arthrobacter gengyunqii]